MQFFPIIYSIFILLQTARDMSLLKYFKNSEKASAWDPYKVCESIKNDWPDNITANELQKVQECLKVAQEENKKRTVYAEKDKQEIESMRQFVELQRPSENFNQSSQS